MGRRKRSNKPKQAKPIKSPRQQAEQLFEKVHNLLNEMEVEQALEVLNNAPARMQQEPEYRFLRGTAYALAGENHSAIEDLEFTAKNEPEMYALNLNLAILYLRLEYWHHSQHAVQKFLKRNPPDPEAVKSAKELLELVESEINIQSEHSLVPKNQFLQAAPHNEKAQFLLATGKFKQAQYAADTAIRAARNWAAPRNNRALILFFQGKTEQAVAEEEHVLAEIQVDSIHALSNLIMFHTCLWQQEQAAHYGERLAELVLAPDSEPLDLAKAIESMGILENDAVLWELAQKLKAAAPDRLRGLSWYILGAAAANGNHLREAKKYMQRALEQAPEHNKWIEPALSAVKKGLRSKKAAIGTRLDGRFPYIHFLQLWPRTIIEEMLGHLAAAPDEVNDFVDTHLKRFINRYSYIAYAGKLILWGEALEEVRRIGLDILAAADHPAADAEIRRFATSPYGSDHERMEALGHLQKHMQIERGESIPFWSAAEGAWHDIHYQLSEILPGYEPDCDPRAGDLLDQSKTILFEDQSNPKKQAQARKLLEQAVEIDPNCAMALHNLGSIKINQGEKEAGIALIKQAIEVDPEYLFAYTTLAQLELKNENYEACKGYIQKVTLAPRVPANAMARILDVQLHLALAEKDYKGAKSALEMLKTINPEHPDLDRLEMIVTLADLPELLPESLAE